MEGHSIRRSTAKCAFAVAAVLTSLSACYSPPVRFREAALPPEAREDPARDFSLPFDAYVIGIEKNNSSRIGQIEECDSASSSSSCLRAQAQYYKDNPDLLDELRKKYTHQLRPTFVSHVIRYEKRASNVSCFRYNIYASDGAGFCDGVTFHLPTKRMSVRDGWDAVKALSEDVRTRAAAMQATHLIVYVMGWNTPQWEAFQNYRALFSNVEKAAQGSGATAFRPLFFGVTWPSTGDPSVPGSDYGIKAKDADEVGAVWTNLLVNSVLADAGKALDIPIVVVGHSFGARATSRAVFSAPLVASSPDRRVDLLISLQGAYSYQRFVRGEGQENSPYRDFAERARAVVLTASNRDEAVTAAGHAAYFVGSSIAYENSQTGPAAAVFDHQTAAADGTVSKLACASDQVRYVNATAFIKDPVAGTGGLAHSDIYDQEAGQFTLQLIRSCAPGKSWRQVEP